MVDCAFERNPESDETPTHGESMAVVRRRARSEAVWANFTAISATMVLLYGFFTVAHYLSLPPPMRGAMMTASVAAMLTCGGVFLFLYRSPVRERLAHPLAALILTVILVNSALHLHLSGLPGETSNFVLIIIGCGIFLYSTRWCLAMLALAVLTWLAIALAHGGGDDWTHFGFFALQVVLMSLIAHYLRLRALDQLLRSRMANETQRRELTTAVRALERTQDRLRQISEATFEAVFLHRNGRIVDVNEQAVRLFGYSREELQGKHLALLLAPEVRTQLPVGRKTLHSATGSSRDGRIHESVGLDKRGRRFPIEFGAVQRRPRPDQIDAAVMRDISDRQRLEQRLRDFVENAADYIYETEPDGRFTYVNGAIQGSIYWQGEFIGASCYLFVHPDVRDRVRAEVEHHDFVAEPILYQEFPIDTGSSPRELWLGQNVQPILARGVLTGYRVVARDITERVMAVREVMAARREADEANRSKSRFLSSMSHELRTPLNGILGYAQLLQEEIHGTLNERQRKYAASVTDCSAHLLTLIDDLLDLSKVEIDAVDLNPAPLSVAVMAQSAAAMVRRDAADKDIEILLEADEADRVNADPRRLRQILINLLGNAVKYSPRGDKIRVASHRASADLVEITVEDRGPGVRPEHQERIFSEFFQSDQIRDGGLGGSGIGLALVQKLVALHGGEVGYRDRDGGGSIFWIRLPATDAEAAPLEGAIAPGQVRKGSADARILVVDDIEANLFLVTEALSARGHVVEVARNGEEAIERAAAFDPALILMDMRMPVMDGFQATRRLKSMEQFRQTPIVALTASVSADAISECIGCGCAEHLGKPVQLGSLFACIDRNLGGAPEATPVPAKSKFPEHATAPPLRILIAEDNPTNRDFMGEFFRQLPDEVAFAANGREAVERALGEPFDLVLMDIHMPELNGIEATREIRRRRSAHLLPIVGLSGIESQEDIDVCMAAGMNDFITKPVRFARVLEVLESYRDAGGSLSRKNQLAD